MTDYQQARDDFEFLEALAEVTDMVEIDADVWRLMRSPTKATAADMYRAAIDMWFREHGSRHVGDPEIDDIAERYGAQT